MGGSTRDEQCVRGQQLGKRRPQQQEHQYQCQRTLYPLEAGDPGKKGGEGKEAGEESGSNLAKAENLQKN